MGGGGNRFFHQECKTRCEPKLQAQVEFLIKDREDGPVVRESSTSRGVAAGSRQCVAVEFEGSRDIIMGIVENKVGARLLVVCDQT